MGEQRTTFCRICEPLCGMVATVEDGRLVKLRPDREHPLSRGFACPKGIAFEQVQNDPDRVLHPLRRRADGGGFERVSWDVAMNDIVGRLRRIHAEDGGRAIGIYFGNPGAFSYSHTSWAALFKVLAGTRLSSANSQDTGNRLVASRLLYGSPTALPVPDVTRTDLMVIVGGNPLVSHGSLMTAPRIKEELHGIVDRGGRVVVVDPRRTETAREFEWLPVVPDSDVWLLLSLLHVLFEEGLSDEAAIARQASGVDALRAIVAPYPPERTERHTSVPAETVRELARALATTPRAVVYGRIGTSTCSSGTLTTLLLDAVNLVAGNLDREGGAMFGSLGLPGEQRLGRLLVRLAPPLGAKRTRVGDLPVLLGLEPSTMLAKEITTPGEGQIRALIVSSGNPVLSSPNGEELEAALGRLDLHVSLDMYVNETNAHADYILPATTMYEREDVPLLFQTLYVTPLRQATEAVVPPAGEARPEWLVYDGLIRGLWRRTRLLTLVELSRRLAERLGGELTPRGVLDVLVRLAEGGDRFGLARGGLTLRRLLSDHPHGKVIAPHLTAGRLKGLVLHRGGKVALDLPELAAEVERLERRRDDGAYPLRMIGMRELRSENSWMHNAELLLRGGRVHAARMHPEDASAHGIEDGALARISSRHGTIELPVQLTEDITPGAVAIPHGWGHKGTGGWQRANGVGGANVNQLMSTDPADIEPVAGMSHLNGVPVRAEAAAQASLIGSPSPGNGPVP